MNDAVARLAMPLRWLLVAGIAYTVANSVLYFLSPPATPPVTPVSRGPAATAPTADLNAILAANLFGTAQETAEEETRDEPAVVTTLPLELLAVWVAEDAERSVATIAQRGRQGENYQVGDEVPGNATLVEVHPNHVVLRRAGVREALHFPSMAQSLARRTPMPAEDYGIDSTFPDVLDDAPIEDMPEDFGGADEIPPEAGLEDASVRQLVDEYREELERNPEQALDELGVEPVEDGVAQGYRIGDLAHSPYLSQTGLQPGDVILSVNGRPVGDLSQDRLELDNVLAQGSARLEVQRGNRRFFVTASLQ
ncbi:MAG TPA: type II secretion system protein N [Pseudomonadales bacterium]